MFNAACGKRSPNIRNVGPYIINGQWAARGAWPWQVMLIAQTLNGPSLCGGVLLIDRWILTAAHCIEYVLFFPLTQLFCLQSDKGRSTARSLVLDQQHNDT